MPIKSFVAFRARRVVNVAPESDERKRPPNDAVALRAHASSTELGIPYTAIRRTYSAAGNCGVVASALIFHRTTGAASPVSVWVKGGDRLEVSWERDGDTFRDVTLTGPADFVFDGAVSL